MPVPGYNSEIFQLNMMGYSDILLVEHDDGVFKFEYPLVEYDIIFRYTLSEHDRVSRYPSVEHDEIFSYPWVEQLEDQTSSRSPS
jgi:hypothetical protein